MECEGGVAPVFPSLLELTKAEKCLMDASTGDDMDGQRERQKVRGSSGVNPMVAAVAEPTSLSLLIGAPRLFDAIPRGRWRTPQGKDKS